MLAECGGAWTASIAYSPERDVLLEFGLLLHEWPYLSVVQRRLELRGVPGWIRSAGNCTEPSDACRSRRREYPWDAAAPTGERRAGAGIGTRRGRP